MAAEIQQANVLEDSAAKDTLRPSIQAAELTKERVNVNKELKDPELEARINSRTLSALMKDSDKFPPVHNADGSSKYRMTQVGLTDRQDTQEHVTAHYFKRDVEIVVPAGAKKLSDAEFSFHERKAISEQSFKSMLKHDLEIQQIFDGSKTNSTQANLFAHGVSEGALRADSQALLLQLTTGHPTVDIDWDAHPWLVPSPEHYRSDTRAAAKAGPHLEKMIDKTIASTVAAHTNIIGFSHGNMFDTRYLNHRVTTGLSRINTIVMAHPDVPIYTRELNVSRTRPDGLFGKAAEHAFVIGGVNDHALQSAPFILGRPGERLGSNSDEARRRIVSNHAIPITEIDRTEPSTEHFVNFSGIDDLINGKQDRNANQIQESYRETTWRARQ